MFITSTLIWQMTVKTQQNSILTELAKHLLRGVKWQFTFTLTFFSLMVQQKHQLVVLSPAIVCVNLLLLLPYCFKLSLCLNCLIHLFWPFQSWHMQLLHLKNKPWSLKIGQPGLFYFNLPLQLSISLCLLSLLLGSFFTQLLFMMHVSRSHSSYRTICQGNFFQSQVFRIIKLHSIISFTDLGPTIVLSPRSVLSRSLSCVTMWAYIALWFSDIRGRSRSLSLPFLGKRKGPRTTSDVWESG